MHRISNADEMSLKRLHKILRSPYDHTVVTQVDLS